MAGLARSYPAVKKSENLKLLTQNTKIKNFKPEPKLNGLKCDTTSMDIRERFLVWRKKCSKITPRSDPLGGQGFESLMRRCGFTSSTPKSATLTQSAT